MPLISIIVPVFNVEKYLSRCLDSIIKQTFRDVEILLIDDGSSDNSYEIMSEYAQKDSRIKIFKCKHKGITTVRKNGIEWASGNYIGFVDSDDWIEPDMYNRLYEVIVQNNCDLVSSDIYVHHVDGHNEIIFDNYKEGIYTNLSSDIYPIMLHDFTRNTKGLRCYLVTKIFRADLLKKVVDKIDARVFYGEDAMLLYRYCLTCQSVYIMREAFYHYEMRSESAETKFNENEPENMYRLFSNLKQAFEESPYSEILMSQLYQYALLLNNRVLYGLYGIDLGKISSWTFPYLKGLCGKRVIIYGAGPCGRALYSEFCQQGCAEKVIVVDKKHDMINKKPLKCSNDFLSRPKCEIQPVDVIMDIDYDYIVVAIQSNSIAEEVIRELKNVWGVSDKKIIWSNPYKVSAYSILSLAYL